MRYVRGINKCKKKKTLKGLLYDANYNGNATVLAGVTIGDNCTIDAGSIVIKDILENSVAVGNPCRVIKRFNIHHNKTFFQVFYIDI